MPTFMANCESCNIKQGTLSNCLVLPYITHIYLLHLDYAVEVYIPYYYLWRPKPAIGLENSWHRASLTNSTEMDGCMRLDNIHGEPFFTHSNIKLLKARPLQDYTAVRRSAKTAVSNLLTELIKTVATTTSTCTLDRTTGRVT
jgi:hypothetical protein